MDFITANTEYTERLNQSLSKVTDLDLAKKRLTYSRWKVAENLDKLLFEFETNVKKNDANVFWCPDVKTSIEQLNKQLKNFNKVSFLNHNSVNYLVNTADIKVPEPVEDPDAVVIGAKFIIANTGNYYTSFNSIEDYEKVIRAKKIVVVAGIDSVLSLQSELYTAKQLYAIFETGNLHYTAEILGRPGRVRGLNSEASLLLVDLNKSKLLDIPDHRPLFSLLNFDLPPVCPMQQFSYHPEDRTKTDTLQYLFYAFLNGLKDYQSHLNGNYGLQLLNRYLPYDINLYKQILDARALLHADEKKKPAILNLFNKDMSNLVMQPKKFKEAERFKKFAEHNFFGQ
jgi:L-lactate utilization protein LutB